MIIFLLIILCIILTFALSISLYYNWKHANLILEIQDAIEFSLDELDQIYGRITLILEKPVFFESVEVRQVIADISDAQASVLKVANVLIKSVEQNEGSDAQEKDS